MLILWTPVPIKLFPISHFINELEEQTIVKIVLTLNVD